MSKKSGGGNSSVPKAVRDQNSQQTNRNPGTNGTNRIYDIEMGHRGTQIAQNQRAAKSE